MKIAYLLRMRPDLEDKIPEDIESVVMCAGDGGLYSEEDLRQLEVILNLTRDLGVNLAGVEIILNMRRKMERMQDEVNEFVSWVRQELAQAAREGWQERLQEALVRLPPTPLVRTEEEETPPEG